MSGQEYLQPAEILPWSETVVTGCRHGATTATASWVMRTRQSPVRYLLPNIMELMIRSAIMFCRCTPGRCMSCSGIGKVGFMPGDEMTRDNWEPGGSLMLSCTVC